MPRILLSTVCREPSLYDYFRENAPHDFRWRFGMPRHISFGLRFLRQNLPDIQIMEYPSRREFAKAVRRGWDTVGFSFYLDETNAILEMAEEARRAGVREIWAGNYGALTPAIQSNFDQTFVGYGEDAVAQRLGKTIDHIEHPPLVVRFKLPGGWTLPVGVLFTTRGCSFTCTFCQTTAFAPRPKAIPLSSLERAVKFYVEHGIQFVLILDENFGNIPSHAEAAIELLARYGVHWFVQSRVDLFLRNFKEWKAKGMEGALFGIESFHQDVLKQIHKNEKVEAIRELTARLNAEGLYAGVLHHRLPRGDTGVDPPGLEHTGRAESGRDADHHCDAASANAVMERAGLRVRNLRERLVALQHQEPGVAASEMRAGLTGKTPRRRISLVLRRELAQTDDEKVCLAAATGARLCEGCTGAVPRAPGDAEPSAVLSSLGCAWFDRVCAAAYSSVVACASARDSMGHDLASMAKGSFGALLRKERETREISLNEITVATRIAPRFLEAFENEQWERLPGGFFNRGFVRAIARYLGLSEERLLAEYDVAYGVQSADGPALVKNPIPSPSKWLVGLLALVLLLGVAGVIAGGVYGWRHYARRAARRDAVSAQPAQTVALPNLMLEPTTGAGTTAFAASVPQPLDLAVSTSVATRIRIVADGRVLLDTNLLAGETRHFSAGRQFEVTAADPASVLLELNGQAIPAPGSLSSSGTIVLSQKDLRQARGGDSKP
jgi:hypothetical protein